MLTAFNSIVEVRSEDEEDEDYDESKERNDSKEYYTRKNTYGNYDPNIKKQKTIMRTGKYLACFAE